MKYNIMIRLLLLSLLALPAQGLALQQYAKVIVVAKSGGDFINPVDAIQSITDASATNRYLIKIMPGIYNVGQPLNWKKYVDIEGAGEKLTTLTATNPCQGTIVSPGDHDIKSLAIEATFNGGTTGCWQYNGVYVEGTNLKLSRVTVNSTGFITGGSYITGIKIFAPNSYVPITPLTLDQVKVNVVNTGTLRYDSVYGVSIGGYAAEMKGSISDSIITISGPAAGAGIQSPLGTIINTTINAIGWNQNAIEGSRNPLIRNVTLNGNIYIYGDETLKLESSLIFGTIFIPPYWNAGHAYLMNSQINNINSYGTGHVITAGCYDENYDPIPDGAH